MSPEKPGDQRTSKALVILMGACVLASVGVGAYFLRSEPAASPSWNKGFDISHVDARPPVATTAASYPPAPKTSPLPVLGSLDAEMQPGANPGAGAAAGSASSASQPAAGPSADERQNEADFLAHHRAELERYQRNLAGITGRYYKQYPVVRQVDSDFAGMSRYMALKQRYAQDGNPFEFVRGAISLPEVRAEIASRMAQPSAWVAAIGMISDTLKNDPPPPSVYQQAQQFMLEDPTVSAYTTKEFTQDVTQDIPIMVQSIPPGTDMSALQKVVRDVSPASVPGP